MSETNRRVRSLVFVLIACTVGSAPFAHPEDPSGSDELPKRPGPEIEINAEYGWTALRNFALDYAFVDASGGLGGGGRVATLGYDRETAPRVSIAWRFDKPGSPALRVSFWEAEIDGTSSTGVHPSDVGALLSSPQFARDLPLVDSATASSRIKATQGTAGVEWRPRLGDRMTMSVRAGVYFYRFEESTLVVYTGDSTQGVPLEERITMQGDAKGIGPVSSVAFEYAPSPRLRWSAALGLALPVGEVERFLSDTLFQADPLMNLNSVVADREGDRRALPHLEGGLRLEWSPVGRLRLALGYEFMLWSDARTDLRFSDVLALDAAVPSSNDAVFEGPVLSLGYSF